MFNEVREVREHIDVLFQDEVPSAFAAQSMLNEIWPLFISVSFQLAYWSFLQFLLTPFPPFHSLLLFIVYIRLSLPPIFFSSVIFTLLSSFLSSLQRFFFHLRLPFLFLFLYCFISFSHLLSPPTHFTHSLSLSSFPPPTLLPGLFWFSLTSSSAPSPSFAHYISASASLIVLLIIAPAKWSFPLQFFPPKWDKNKCWRGFKRFQIKGTWRGPGMRWW